MVGIVTGVRKIPRAHFADKLIIINKPVPIGVPLVQQHGHLIVTDIAQAKLETQRMA
jgi:hypothetical protein